MCTTRDLTERLDRLEQQNQNLKRIICGVAVVTSAVFLIAAAAPGVTEQGDATLRTVHAERLAIVDSDGKERIVLAMDAGEPSLTMSNHDGERQVYLGIDENWNDSAYLSVCSRLQDGDVDKQAVLVATKTDGVPGSRKNLSPGNAQLLLYDLVPGQQNATAGHLLRLSSGMRTKLKPYIEIREFKERPANHQLDFEVLMAGPAESGQRLLLDSTPDIATLSGLRVLP